MPKDVQLMMLLSRSILWQSKQIYLKKKLEHLYFVSFQKLTKINYDRLILSVKQNLSNSEKKITTNSNSTVAKVMSIEHDPW